MLSGSWLKLRFCPSLSGPPPKKMLSLFQCCGNQFFAVSPEALGHRSGPGYQHSTPVILRVRCPHCEEKAEVRLAAPSMIAYSSPATDSGIRLLREPHGALLEPIQLTPRRLVELQAEGGSKPQGPGFGFAQVVAVVLLPARLGRKA